MFIFLLYSEYSVHYTRLKYSDSGSFECQVIPRDQFIGEIATLGSPNLKILYLPGFLLNKR